MTDTVISVSDQHEATTAGTAVGSLAKRAELAMLTLQLRAAEQEADDAERELARIESLFALQQVGDPVESLVSRRRVELDHDLDRARREGDAEVASARAAAGQATLAGVSDTPVLSIDATSPSSSSAVGSSNPDLTAFAAVFADSFAKAFEARVTSLSPAPVQARSWAHLKHIDVLLIAAATAILGVVVAAWLV